MDRYIPEKNYLNYQMQASKMMHGNESPEFKDWASKLDYEKLKDFATNLTVYTPQLRVIPSPMVMSGVSYISHDCLFVSEEDIYKFVFSLCHKPEDFDSTVTFCFNFAKRKINLYIDNLVKKYTNEKDYTAKHHPIDNAPI